MPTPLLLYFKQDPQSKHGTLNADVIREVRPPVQTSRKRDFEMDDPISNRYSKMNREHLRLNSKKDSTQSYDQFVHDLVLA